MKFKSITILIPTYNEEKTIKQTIDSVKKANTLKLKKQIIIIDDGSTDNTQKKIKSLKYRSLLLLAHTTNRGKGAALRTGFKKATGDIIIIQDADLEYDPSDYPSLLQPILDGKADCVYGSRFINHKPHRILYFWHQVGNTIITLFSNALTNLNLTDMETGYKVFTREVIKKIHPKLNSNRFGFEPEVTAQIAKLAKREDIKIYEVGISYYGRTYKEGKKITWKDGILALWYIVKYNIFS